MGWRYRVFGASQRHLPEWAQRPLRRLAGGRLSTGPDGKLLLTTGPVEFEGASFSWTAPFKEFDQAQATGIESRLSRLSRRELEPGAVALDVGSNYGFVAHVMARAVEPGGTVVAFEADADIAETLRRTADRNGLTGTLRVVTGRVADEDREPDRLTVDTWVRQAGLDRLDVLLIDTDGGDLAVLRGATETVERFHPVLAVEISADQEEIHRWLADRYEHVVGMEGQPVDSAPWPPNLIASNHPVDLLSRRS